MLGLTGVIVVTTSKGNHHDRRGGTYTNGHLLRQRDSINHNVGQASHVLDKSKPFVAPVEFPAVVIEKTSSHFRTKHLQNNRIESPDLDATDQSNQQDHLPIGLPQSLPKTNMRKLGQVRNISKFEENQKRYSSQRRRKIDSNQVDLETSTNSNISQELQTKGHEDSVAHPSGKTNISTGQSSNQTVHRKQLPLKLEDIFIGVKTTTRYHQSRLNVLYKTWFQQAKRETYFFTDGEDPEWQNKTGNHMVNTGCQPDHHRQSLCCKFAAMFVKYVESRKRWFCQLDDDNYLNIPNLLRLLDTYPSDKDLYLGRSSLNHPIETMDRENDMKTVRFWFATGGAGFCLSKALAYKMLPYAGGGMFQSMCNRIRLPDDVTVGFIIEKLLDTKLTSIRRFNSHLQSLKVFRQNDLKEQITLSYGINNQRDNVVTVPDAIFSKKDDPTRLLSLHCYLFPYARICRR